MTINSKAREYVLKYKDTDAYPHTGYVTNSDGWGFGNSNSAWVFTWEEAKATIRDGRPCHILYVGLAQIGKIEPLTAPYDDGREFIVVCPRGSWTATRFQTEADAWQAISVNVCPDCRVEVAPPKVSTEAPCEHTVKVNDCWLLAPGRGMTRDYNQAHRWGSKESACYFARMTWPDAVIEPVRPEQITPPNAFTGVTITRSGTAPLTISPNLKPGETCMIAIDPDTRIGVDRAVGTVKFSRPAPAPVKPADDGARYVGMYEEGTFCGRWGQDVPNASEAAQFTAENWIKRFGTVRGVVRVCVKGPDAS